MISCVDSSLSPARSGRIVLVKAVTKMNTTAKASQIAHNIAGIASILGYVGIAVYEGFGHIATVSFLTSYDDHGVIVTSSVGDNGEISTLVEGSKVHDANLVDFGIYV